MDVIAAFLGWTTAELLTFVAAVPAGIGGALLGSRLVDQVLPRR